MYLFDSHRWASKTNKSQNGSNVFELRIYEGYSEDAVKKKIEMFNKEELKIFDDTGLYSVFFGEQISGPLMPSLTYMLAFESMRNEMLIEKFFW